MLFLSRVSFQEIRNYRVPANTVHLDAKWKVTECCFRCSRNTIFSQGRNYLQVKPSIKYRPRRFSHASFRAGGQDAVRHPTLFVPQTCVCGGGGGGAAPTRGVPVFCVLLPVDVTPALPAAPAHLKQLYVGMTSPATKMQPLLGWDTAAVKQGAT